MALVRVYCGLASADSAGGPAPAGSTLTSAVVDDAGRLLHVCEIGDDPAGYARLGALLVERSGGPSGAAVAADSDDHVVISLLSASGRPLAIADDDSVDDFAERFADDESLEEMQSPPAERRAVGLARALQAGALSTVTLPAPRDLAGYRSVLAAHGALANGRYSAAVTLREVLRELYPAALRAYPDPAEPVPLAVLDALPEPGMLSTAGTRGRDTSVAADAIAAHLAADGIADAETITQAVTALQVAIAETPLRGAANKTLTSAVAETVRQAVAAVRACDAGCDSLVATLAARLTAPRPALTKGAVGRGQSTSPAAPTSAPPNSGLQTLRPTRNEPALTGGRRSRPEPVDDARSAVPPRPTAPLPVAPAPVMPPPTTPTSNPAATRPAPVPPVPAPPAVRAPAEAPPIAAPTPAAPGAVPGHLSEPPANRPVSAPPPPPGITPIVPSQRGAPLAEQGELKGPRSQRRGVPPADAGEPFRPTLTTAALNSARAERQRPTPITPRTRSRGEPTPSSGAGFGATDVTVPAQRTAPESAPPGSRANWPLVSSPDERPETSSKPEPSHSGGARDGSGIDAPTDPTGGDVRVKPPWLADDLPQEPPMLRLVEPPPLADRALRDPSTPPAELHLDSSSLRLIVPDDASRGDRTAPRADRPRSDNATTDHGAPPVADEEDGDLLIFAAARSAWFTGQPEESEVEWSSTADTGWRAAEQAARPAVGAETGAGLPKRVPQANLVPGSPLRDEAPLRIVRDAASLAQNTTGYFQGWRRGQEIGGFAVGGRPGREAAGGWDFSRDHGEREESRDDYEYRPAGHRS